MSAMTVAIGVICTALMIGSVVWYLVLERRGNDDNESGSGDNEKNSEK